MLYRLRMFDVSVPRALLPLALDQDSYAVYAAVPLRMTEPNAIGNPVETKQLF